MRGDYLKKLNEIKEIQYKNILIISLISISFYFLLYNIPAIWKFLGYIFGILSPFIIGGCLAFVVNIPMKFIEKTLLRKFSKKSAKRGIALTVSILLVILAVVMIAVLIVPQLIESIKSLEDKIPLFADEIIKYIDKHPFLAKRLGFLEDKSDNIDWNMIYAKTKEVFVNENSKIFSNALSTASNIAGGLFNFFIAFIFSIYILFDKEKLQRQSNKLLFALLPENSAKYTKRVFSIANFYFTSFIRGQVTDAMILGAIVFVGMSILRLPYAAMIGILSAVLTLIPLIGPIIAASIGFIYKLIEPPAKDFMFLIFMVVAQQIEGNFIYPRVVGSSLSIPSMWTLFAITVGGSLLGVIGMWLFVPLFAIIYTLLGEYINDKLKNKNIKIE